MNGRDDMTWWVWVLIGIGAAALITTFREIPSIRRYLRLKSM